MLRLLAAAPPSANLRRATVMYVNYPNPMEVPPPSPAPRPATPLVTELRRWARIISMLYVQRVKGFSVPSAPLFDPASTPFFVERLTHARRYLEFGSGGSTILASELGKPFVTIESDPYFLKAVEAEIRAKGLSLDPTQQSLVPVSIGLTEAWGVPVFQRKTAGRLSRWKRYVTAPWDRGGSDVSPDLILIDGRFRVACALEVARQLRDRTDWTLLIDDYAERPHYWVVEEFLEKKRWWGGWRCFGRERA